MKTATAILMAITLVACDALEPEETADSLIGAPCDSNRRECSSDRTQTLKCENGVWIIWDDCDSPCKYRNGNARCGGWGGGDPDDGEGECLPEEKIPDDVIELDPIERPIQGCCPGPFELKDNASKMLLEECACVDGDLLVHANWDFVTLPQLVEVTGTVEVQMHGEAMALGLTGLKKVGRVVAIGTTLTNLGLDKLEEAREGIMVQGNNHLRGIHLPSLVSTPSVEIFLNANLTCESGNFSPDLNTFTAICDNLNCGDSSCIP